MTTQRVSKALAARALTQPNPKSRTAAHSAIGAVVLAMAGMASSASAATVGLQVTVENLAAANSVSFAPLHLGFHSGSFDAFNLGAAPSEAIISVAEGGAGGAWQAAFAAADPGATRGTLGGLLQPGQSSSSTYVVDTDLNPFFTFASMVVPSNDFFIGNDSPTAFRLFDAAGALIVDSINQKARQIWDAGSETFDPAAAAFVGNNDLRTAQNSVVSFNFAELAGFNGATTGTGYIFNSGLVADSDIYRISFQVVAVPEPSTYALMALGLLGLGAVSRRQRRA